ncbi:MAG: hypothetical protein FGM52_10975 [Mycobacterium sp.]|nr:hypothetical protein [Mycobacterium sp.]
MVTSAALPPDIATSPLFNADLAPTPQSRCTWTTYNFAALWIAMPSAGVNPIAMVALLIGVAPNVPGFLRSVQVLGGGADGWDAVYPTPGSPDSSSRRCSTEWVCAAGDSE